MQSTHSFPSTTFSTTTKAQRSTPATNHTLIPSATQSTNVLNHALIPIATSGNASHTSERNQAHGFLEKQLLVLLPELRKRALVLAKNSSLADDIVQETCERALRFSYQFKQGTNLKAWTFQIMFTVFVSDIRKRKRRHAFETRYLFEVEGKQSIESNSSLLSSTEQILASLPKPYVEVIRLVDLEEKSYQETAELLSIPVGTVMSRLFRARRILQLELCEKTDCTPAKMKKARFTLESVAA